MLQPVLKLVFSGCLMICLLSSNSWGQLEEAENRSKLRPTDITSQIIIPGPAPVGDLRLWVPEGIASNVGFSAVYPVGQPWHRQGEKWIQEVGGEGIYGRPSNFIRVDPETFECNGIRIPVDGPVEWRTTVVRAQDGADFTIKLKNVGDRTIRKTGAAICLKFLQGDWWADENTYVLSQGKVHTLAELGRDAGLPAFRSFQAYLLRGESFDNVFYQQLWGFNRHRLDTPMMVSCRPDADVCVAITADRAYFLHSNKGNPCTDIMLAFGDLKPGETTQSSGRVWIQRGKPHDFLTPTAPGFRR